jgi:hypothetical protein
VTTVLRPTRAAPFECLGCLHERHLARVAGNLPGKRVAT